MNHNGQLARNFNERMEVETFLEEDAESLGRHIHRSTELLEKLRNDFTKCKLVILTLRRGQRRSAEE